MRASIVACTAMLCAAAQAPKPSYVLNGYSLTGVPGVQADDLTAKLNPKANARITEADIVRDQNILAAELKARHVDGQLLTTLAEKNGRVWVLFDVQPARAAHAAPASPALDTQVFEGNRSVGAQALISATGLKPGEPLGPENLQAARRGIADAYGKARPGARIRLRSVIHTGPDGRATLTWTVMEPG